jgi:hypothetical protein
VIAITANNNWIIMIIIIIMIINITMMMMMMMIIQVIGITDTGLDFNSCFFADPAVPLPTCVGEGFVNTSGAVNPLHRKIVTYVRGLCYHDII